MSKLRVFSFAMSVDGYSAGPNQDLQNPLGVNGPDLMEWFFHTRAGRCTARQMESGDRQRHRRVGFLRDRCLDSRAQHVRSGPRAVAG